MKILENSMEMQCAVRDSEILIVQFGSEACGPCHSIQNKIDAWCKKAKNINCIYVPVEVFSELAAQSGVFAVPTILVYVEGKLTVRESGYFSLNSVF